MTPRELTAHWRSKASVFREHEQTSVAIAYELCAKDLDEALRSIAEAPLTLAEAAEISGYSADHLGRLIREGRIPNAGRHGRRLSKSLKHRDWELARQQADEFAVTRLLVTSNEDWVWPADIDDRRLVIFRVSDARMGDREYFQRLVTQLEEGGYGKLLQILQDREIEGWRRREPPQTEALAAQVSESLTPEMSWVLQILEDGVIHQADHLPDGGIRVPLAVLYDDYVCSRDDRRYKKTESAFAFFIQEALRANKTDQRIAVNTARRDGVRSTLYTLPPLGELRAWYRQNRRGAPQHWDGSGSWGKAEAATRAPWR